ncbi:MAG TPA: cupin domain-containing protein [Terriglobales bacterium]|nr:cupin domain-containing protein [Terriglobales bacterium]
MSVVQASETAWKASRTPGISVKVLRSDKASGESTTLIRVDAGAKIPPHDHPGGEEIFVLEGDLTVGGDRMKAGDYLYTPPSMKHAASSDGGCVFLVTLPKPVVILD